ncbi:beta subunit of citrate lyase [Daldinia caldariorum]|uniref:beta subunit of citrate lyase n=1 Tax=Daldinia caldariorum TaxID=326644 RepID=UPI002007D876|nr:beta subunit of citrate lyase [Daldinia caldariorum]KAI1470093.1 beta subunit of citrate lyase [Daldinia caldariorum]
MYPPVTNFLRRAMLYVPSSSPRMLTKSLGLTCDTVIYDLEDSVTPTAKAEARAALKTHMNGLLSKPPNITEFAVRINSPGSPEFEKDVKLIPELHFVDTVIVPKVNVLGDVRAVSHALRRKENHIMREKPIKLMAMIETARAVMNLSTICEGPRLNGLIFAAEDFALDLSLTRTPDLKEFLYARSAIVTAARARAIPNVIDLVCTSYQGPEAVAQLERECQDGKRMGFTGKQVIHPSQIKTVQRLFTPSAEEVEWAVRVTIAGEKAVKAKRGAWVLDGKMIDAPVVGKAKDIVNKARKCDLDVDGLLEKWKDQEFE